MATSEVTVRVNTCDAPDCGKRHADPTNGTYSPGVHADVTVVGKAGAHDLEVYACRLTHLKPAIAALLAEAIAASGDGDGNVQSNPSLTGTGI